MVFRMRPIVCRVVAAVRFAAGYREKSMGPRMISPSWSYPVALVDVLEGVLRNDEFVELELSWS